ncbi:MAG TPA: protein kinase [Planctomycetota bacterium]|nr:protein kinase [Planctomycetota bacterium]
MSEQDTIPAGTVVGGCKILECIGTGGMGQVYKAQHQRLSRVIALKILPEDVIRRHPAGIERFFQEARTLANVEHPNVLTIHDCGQDGSWHYLQTRFVEGKNLEELVTDTPAGLSWQQVRDILVGALLGLGAVHRAGMVHRDVKPANFMLDAGQRVILMDFGLAKFLSASNDARTEPGYVLGTPQYMSPEQCDGLELDPRSDIYSLGCVAYFLIAGKRPFDSENPLAIMKMHRDTYAPPLLQVRPSAGAGICRIIERMMQKNPDDRYPDTDSTVQELRALGTDAEPAPPPPRRTTSLVPPSGPDSSMPQYPKTSAQPAGMPPTAGPMPASPPTVQPRGVVQAAGGFARAAGSPVPVGPTTQSLEQQSMENLYRATLQPQSSYDPMGATITGPSGLAGQMRQLTPPAGLPAQPLPAGIPVEPLVHATPAAPLPPPATPAAPAPAAPPAGAKPVPAGGVGSAGPSTVELQAGVQKLRRVTAKIDRPADATSATAAPVASAPAAVAEPVAATGADAPMDGANRNSQLLQAIQCKHCRHIWRIDRARLGKNVRCPNCSKDTLAQLPDNLLKPLDKARLFLKILIVVVLLGSFTTAVYFVYRHLQPADTSPMTIQAKMNDFCDVFKKADFGLIYDQRFTPNLQKSMSRAEWTSRWNVKMNDREVIQATLDYGDQHSSPITANLKMVVRRVTGDHGQETYNLRLVLVKDDRVWKIDELRME